MPILVVNAGSSSLRMRLVDGDDMVVDDLHLEEWNDDSTPAADWVGRLDGVDGVGHRVVHGGTDLRMATVVDDEVESRIEALTSLAPLHQPRALAGIRMVRDLLPTTPSVACFDTSYHADLPAAAATYALPEEWRRRWGLRRFGFHGLSHACAARRAATLLAPRGASRVVSCHLGAGSSLCASVDGRSVDTTMGFTPLEGLVMATRSGSVDPGLVLWLANAERLGLAEVGDGLEHRSGLTGLTGTTGDMRQVLVALADGDERARLAFDVYIHRVVGEVARMAAAMDGIDALVFTGGVGEHASEVRRAVADRLGFLGVSIDPARNTDADGDTDLTASGAPVATAVVTAREDIEIARQTRQVLAAG
ncbi:MAG TPA: acetate/propionate family kinase [Nocardioidaceae bacterium]|nr:acetate/propionate family kinase [Nocardioidaceae bacterium]